MKQIVIISEFHRSGKKALAEAFLKCFNDSEIVRENACEKPLLTWLEVSLVKLEPRVILIQEATNEDIKIICEWAKGKTSNCSLIITASQMLHGTFESPITIIRL